jgi:hypothetical protein
MRRLCSWAIAAVALVAEPPSVRDLFPPRPTCRVPSREVRVGNRVFQVFVNKETGRVS